MTTRTAKPPAAAPLSRGDVRVVMAGLLSLVMLAALDQTVMATALPSIAEDLGGLDQYSWAVAAYLLPGTAAMPIYGKVIDARGPTPVLAAAATLFIAGSLLCGISQTMDQLVWSRGVQGLGAGGLMTLAFTVTFMVAPPKARPFYQNLFGVVFAIASITGPLAGGALAATAWRWLFLGNVPLAIAGTIAVAIVLRRLPTPRRGGPFDLAGAALLITAALLWLLVASFAGVVLPWTSPTLWALTTAAAGASWLLILRERTAADPVLPLHLFRNRTFALSGLAAALLGVLLFGGVLFIPLYLQLVRGLTPTDSGLAMVPMMLAMVATSILSGKLIGATGRFRATLVTGAALTITGLGIASTFDRTSSPALITASLVLLGAGMGLCMQNVLAAAQTSLPPQAIGAGTSLVSFTRQLGASLGVAILGALLNAQWAARLADTLPPAHDTSRPDAEQLFDGLLASGSPANQLVSGAFLDAFHITMLAATGTALLLAVATAALPSRQPHGEQALSTDSGRNWRTAVHHHGEVPPKP